MRHAIITCSDANCGDFLVAHWARSLRANVDTSDVDVIVIDYGLASAQSRALRALGITVLPGIRDGFPNAIKFRDMERYLADRQYNQILTCDGGDLIFQTDIRPIFDDNLSAYRAATEPGGLLFERMYGSRALKRPHLQQLKALSSGKRMINAGVILAPYPLFVRLCQECNRLMKRTVFGSDQLAINYVLYRDGFIELPQKYNFTITTSSEPFEIRGGEFYLKTGEKIPIVHNAGCKAMFRPIKDFGFGLQHNKLSKATFHAVRAIVKSSDELM